jgi:hypothetical protein
MALVVSVVAYLVAGVIFAIITALASGEPVRLEAPMAISHNSAEDQVVNRVRHALEGFESLDDGVFL